MAVIGDGAFPSGIVYEAMNNTGGLRKKLLVILNDNQMSICPRVGGMGEYLDRLRVNSIYTGIKTEVLKVLNKVPLLGDPAERFLAQVKEAVKAGLHGGMLFEELGFRYMGPVDGHSIPQLCKYLAMVKDVPGPVLLHVVTEKGHGFKPAAEDPVYFHTPAPFTCEEEGVVAFKKSSSKAYTDVVSQEIHRQMEANPKVTVMTAAMCQGTKLEPVRQAFPDRFFDTGICEVAHRGVCRRAGQGRAAADRRYLQHVPATQLRPDLPGSGAAESAGHVRARSRRACRPRRADAPRRVRPGLHAAVSEHGGDGAGRRIATRGR